MKYGLDLPNMGGAGDPRLLAEIAHEAEESGWDGVFIFPDTHALGQGKSPQHLYSVRFAGPEVWGPEAPAKDVVYVDLWDSYLDPA